MLEFTTTILRFDAQGEKTGWTYIKISVEMAEQLVPGNRKGFRVKGYLDEYKFEALSLIPMGGGDFILTLNANVRKAIRKAKGAKVKVKMEVDHQPIKPPAELMDCLADEPTALERFNKLNKSHQNYFTNWINQAKTEPTKTKRIAHTLNALEKGLDFGALIRSIQEERNALKGMKES